MNTRLYRIINIRMSESAQVFDLLPVQFFIGLGNALVNIVAFTLFIYNFPITVLPEVYIVVAAMLLLMNLVYEKVEHALKPLQLLKLVIALSAVLILVLWIGLAKGDKNTFIYIFLVASILLYMLTGYAFWGLVSLLFNVRESRRVFSIVGAGDIPAKLIGYLAVPLLIPFVGIYNVLWFAVASFVFALYLFNKYSRKGVWDKLKEHHIDHNKSEVLGKRDMISFLFGHKLIFAISILSIISYNVFVLIDYTFISQVKVRFHNMADLAVYIAVFFAVGRMIALIFKLIFTSRVIEKLGVVQCLFITPVALLVFSAGVYIYGNSHYTIYIFGVMAMLTEVLRSTIQEPVFFILFQPLKEQLRLKGHIISKGYMYPPSLIIVGLTLWFLHRTGNDFTILQAVKIVLLNLLIWGGIIFFIGRIYLQTVHASIKKGIYSGTEVHVFDNQTIKILLGKISTGKTIESIYALDLLEKGNYTEMVSLLESQLSSTNPDVQRYALTRLDEKMKINTTLLRELLPVAASDNYPEFVNLLCKYDAAFLDEMAADLSSHDYTSRKNIIIHLLEKREFRHLLKAGTEINNLIESSDTKDKELAIDIISEMKHLKFDDVLLKMLGDEHIIKRKAIIAVCKLNLKSLLPVIFNMLATSDRYIVLKGLLLYGDTLFEHITSLENINIDDYSNELIKTAGQLKGIHSKNYLLASLRNNKLQTDKVLEALWDRDYQPESPEEKTLLTKLIQKHLEGGLIKINDYALIQENHYSKVISDSVCNEIRDHLVLALKVCSFLFHKKEINRVIELLVVDNHNKIYNAMEMLDLVLPKKIAKDINQLFEFILDPAGIAKVKEAKDVFISKVIYKDTMPYSSWTRAICIYSCWKNNDWHLLSKLKSLPVYDTGDNVLRETSEFVLQAMNPLDYADNRKNIITQEL